MNFLGIFIFASSFATIIYGFKYECEQSGNTNTSCMLTMTPLERAFKFDLMDLLDAFDALTLDFAISEFTNNTERINRTNEIIREIVNQTQMETFVKKLNLTYVNPTNLTLVADSSVTPQTSGSGTESQSIFSFLANKFGLSYIASFLPRFI